MKRVSRVAIKRAMGQHNLDQIMDGDIKTICDALLAENQLAMLSQLESE